jgi:hypothetical protein
MKNKLLTVSRLPHSYLTVGDVSVVIDRDTTGGLSAFNDKLTVVIQQDSNYYKTVIELSKSNINGDVELSDWLHDVIRHFTNLNSVKK